jgi:hypothetical protein
MNSEFARGLRAIKTGIKKGENDGLVSYLKDEPLTDDWVYHVYKILTPDMIVMVNRDKYQQDSDEIRFGEPCGNLYYGSLLWMAKYIKTLELLQKK